LSKTSERLDEAVHASVDLAPSVWGSLAQVSFAPIPDSLKKPAQDSGSLIILLFVRAVCQLR
jgi:hypothetical protein